MEALLSNGKLVWPCPRPNHRKGEGLLGSQTSLSRHFNGCGLTARGHPFFPSAPTSEPSSSSPSSGEAAPSSSPCVTVGRAERDVGDWDRGIGTSARGWQPRPTEAAQPRPSRRELEMRSSSPTRGRGWSARGSGAWETPAEGGRSASGPAPPPSSEGCSAVSLGTRDEPGGAGPGSVAERAFGARMEEKEGSLLEASPGTAADWMDGVEAAYTQGDDETGTQLGASVSVCLGATSVMADVRVQSACSLTGSFVRCCLCRACVSTTKSSTARQTLLSAWCRRRKRDLHRGRPSEDVRGGSVLHGGGKLPSV